MYGMLWFVEARFGSHGMVKFGAFGYGGVRHGKAVAVGYVAVVQGKVRLCLERYGSLGKALPVEAC